jgi:hypothetical protein
VLKVSGRHAATPERTPIAESYNRYYGSGLYDARYPRPNPPTYRSAQRLARTSSRIPDSGAGSGRYTMPFLHATNAFVCAYDISADACQALELQAAAAGAAADSQRMLITADLAAARAAGPYDLVVALFGVLSHIEGKRKPDRYARLDTLGAQPRRPASPHRPQYASPLSLACITGRPRQRRQPCVCPGAGAPLLPLGPADHLPASRRE